jgi:hypothetical protein
MGPPSAFKEGKSEIGRGEASAQKRLFVSSYL